MTVHTVSLATRGLLLGECETHWHACLVHIVLSSETQPASLWFQQLPEAEQRSTRGRFRG